MNKIPNEIKCDNLAWLLTPSEPFSLNTKKKLLLSIWNCENYVLFNELEKKGKCILLFAKIDQFEGN